MMALNKYKVKNIKWMGEVTLCKECASKVSLELSEPLDDGNPPWFCCQVCYRTEKDIIKANNFEEIFKYEKTEKG